MLKLFSNISLIGVFVCGGAAITFSQTSHPTREEAQKNAGQGVVFKVPDKFMRAPLSGFKGLLLLNADAPAAIVISYPNEGESSDALVKRLIQEIPKIFGGENNELMTWSSSTIEVNPGDKAGSGVMNLAKKGNRQFQLVTFLREHNGITFVYGHFAMRNDTDKDSKVKKYWMNEQGRGVKPFESFWKSFS